MEIITTMTIGCDLGDRCSHVCVLDGAGEVVDRARIKTSYAAFKGWFSKRQRALVAIETGAHTRWVAALLAELGHRVLVANARDLRLIYGGRRKNDRLDAEKLARAARLDPKLLNPVTLRGQRAQADKAILQGRSQLIEARTKLIGCVRGMLKSWGLRVKSGDANAFHKRAPEAVPEELRPALDPVVETIEELSRQIKLYDELLDSKLDEYEESAALTQIKGVGPVTALAFLLTLETPGRFRRSRDVGPFLGLVPKEHQSGKKDPELGISKAGDPYLRQLLVQCAHYILGPFGQDCDLRRFGQRLIDRSGKTPRRGKKRTSPKKRAAVAVARKLAVLMHRLWCTGEVYEPLGYGKTCTEKELAAEVVM